MIAWILVALGQVALMPEPQKRVDFKPETARMVNLAEPLGEALGVKVAVGENLRNEVLAVCAPNVMRKDLAAKIAQCLDADWRRDGTLLVLERSKAREEQMRQREIAYLVPKIREKQAEMMQALTKQGEFSAGLAKALSERVFEMVKSVGWANGNDLEAMGRSTPQGRFALRILASIPPEQIAAIPVGGKAIFRPKPNKRQLAMVLPNGAVDSLHTEHKIYSEAMQQVDLSPYEKPWMSIPMVLKGGPLGEGALDVILRLTNGGANFYSDLSIVDPQGRPVGHVSISLETFQYPKAPPEGPESTIERGQLANELVAAYRSFREGKSFELSPNLRDFLLHPDRSEPLALGLTGAVRSLAQADGKAVVMRAWDSLFFPALGLSRGSSLSLGGFRQLLISTDAQTVDAGAWRIIRPSNPWTANFDQGDRVSTARWLGSAARGGPEFDETLNHFAAHKGGFGPYTILWYRLLFPEKSDGSANEVFGYGPNLLAALTTAQRSAIAGGGQVPISQMSLKARQVIEQNVFGMNGYLNVLNAQGRTVQNPLFREPTEMFPGELPPGGVLTGSRSVTTVVFGLYDNPIPGRNGRIRRGAKDIGYQLAKTAAGVKLDPKQWPTRLSLADAESWILRLDLAPGISASGKFHDRFGSNGRTVTFETMPGPLQERVKKWIDYYKAHPDEAAPPIDQLYDDAPPPSSG